MSCPICKRKADVKFRPFCSKRCADVDLAKWFSGGYAIASTDPDDFDDLEQALDEAAQNDADKLH